MRWPTALAELFHLWLVVAAHAPSSETLQARLLLGVARTANTEHDVTGLLLYREGSFYQLLEGKQTAVNHIFEVIKQDPRHKDVRILFSGETETREFSDWRMGFLNLDGVNPEALAGFSNFLTLDSQPQEFLENLSRGKRLALMFRTML